MNNIAKATARRIYTDTIPNQTDEILVLVARHLTERSQTVGSNMSSEQAENPLTMLKVM